MIASPPPSKLERMLFADYDAVTPTNRRAVHRTDLRNEDWILNLYQRDTIVSSARDARRNMAIAAWMIRKHLDFVANFRFRPMTPNREFNKQLARLMQRWGNKRNCHVAKRHPLRRLMRQIEGCRTIDGDLVIEKMKDGSINLIRGDRIRSPHSFQRSGWVHGVRIHPRTNELLAFKVHKRNPFGSFVFEKDLPASNAILHGYFDDPEQVRGIAPLQTALNDLRDTYETKGLALARMKAEQILGIAITGVKPQGGINPFQGNQQFAQAIDPNSDETPEEMVERWDREEEEESRRGRVDLGKGPFLAELRDGEDLKSVAGNMPSSNAQEFMKTVIQVALKALDIPFSFYSENFTNYYGSKGALQMYKRSAKDKQQDNAELLDDLTEWKIRQWVIFNQLDLPRGWKIDDLEWLWVPDAIPPWDRGKDTAGNIQAMAAGLDNPQSICLAEGETTFEENVEALAEAAEFWQTKLGRFGLPFGFMQVPGAAPISSATNEGNSD